MGEPILTDDDLRAWETWRRMAAIRARTRHHRALLNRAIREVRSFHADHPDAIVAWSGGKDSTVLVHLIRVALRIPGPVMSECDDLDYPGEREYIDGYANEWGLDLDIVEPGFSLQEWIRDNITDIGEDLHSRGADLSDLAFYQPIAEYSADRGIPGVYLGLRTEESRGRSMNRALRGLSYVKRSGEAICQPLADWRALDIYAYMETHGIEPLHVYRCCAYLSPGEIRKSWWVPGAHARNGAAIWLRRYYPSLYRRLCAISNVGRYG